MSSYFLFMAAVGGGGGEGGEAARFPLQKNARNVGEKFLKPMPLFLLFKLKFIKALKAF